MIETPEENVTNVEETEAKKSRRQLRREVGLARKQEVLKLINQYNEEMLVDGSSSITLEELAELEDEYSILEDRYPEKIIEEAKDTSWISKVSWWMFVYPFFVVFLNIPALIKVIGLEVLYFISYKLPNMANTAPVWLLLGLTLYTIPIVLLVITWTIYGLIQNKDNKRMFGYIFILHGVLFLAANLFLLFDFVLPIVNY